MKFSQRAKDWSGRFLFESATRRQRVLALVVILLACLLLMSLSQMVCVRFPVLLWLKPDICKTWEDFDFTQDFDQNNNWWKRVCQLERDWFQIEYQCKDLRQMGNWPVCFDDPITPIDHTTPCIVYSFGIAYDFRFDDAMAEINCTVHSFDPSMDSKDHRRGSRVHFHKLGLGARDNPAFKPRLDSYTKPDDSWNVMTLSSIMKMLGHTPSSISVLKLDIEVNEWSVLDNLLQTGLLANIPQVLIEWHIFRDTPPHTMYDKMQEDFLKFKSLGFRNIWVRDEGRNHWLLKLKAQAEVAYLNINYARPVRPQS